MFRLWKSHQPSTSDRNNASASLHEVNLHNSNSENEGNFNTEDSTEDDNKTITHNCKRKHFHLDEQACQICLDGYKHFFKRQRVKTLKRLL